jgi:hypothetical protein
MVLEWCLFLGGWGDEVWFYSRMVLGRFGEGIWFLELLGEFLCGTD